MHQCHKIHCSRLAKKVKKWFNQTDRARSSNDFEYRFTGLELQNFLQNFMFFIEALETPNDDAHTKFKLHVFAFVCLCLRDAVSLFCRLNIDSQSLLTLTELCLHIFRSYCLFLDGANPTIWSIGNIIPAHAQQVFEKYGMGLGLVSLEGREAKHIMIAIAGMLKTLSFLKGGSRSFAMNLFLLSGFDNKDII